MQRGEGGRVQTPCITLLLVCLFTILICLSLSSSVMSYPDRSARYECYCKEKSECGTFGYFVCRSLDFVCNCSQCSCYADEAHSNTESAPEKESLASVYRRKLHHNSGRRRLRPHH